MNQAATEYAFQYRHAKSSPWKTSSATFIRSEDVVRALRELAADGSLDGCETRLVRRRAEPWKAFVPHNAKGRRSPS